MGRFFLVWATMFLLASCISQKPYYHPDFRAWADAAPPAQPPAYTVFLIGDAGSPQTNPLEPIFVQMKQQMAAAGASSSVVFLGDNLYPKGMPDSLSPDRAVSEKYLLAQLALTREYQGKGYFIPGNHDWAQGRPFGWRYLANQQTFVEDFTGGKNFFLPTDGCPGPVEVSLAEDLTLIAVDTQWWLHPHEKPGVESDCACKDDEQFLLALNQMVIKNRHKKVVMIGHHPMFSNGLHGGHAPLQYHLFPLLDLKPSLWIPLPLLGSVYVGYRTVLGNIQDIPHPRYKQLRKAMLEIFAKHPHLIYANGHDHSIQYHQQQGQHFITSGSGCKTDYVAKRQKARFAWAEKGFARIDFYENQEAWLSFWVAPGDGTEGKLAYRQKLFTYQPQAPFQGKRTPKLIPLSETTYASATSLLQAGKFKTWLLGENYRREWRDTVHQVPILSLATAYGGLEILDRGGGMQTRSLRLRDRDGKEYTLRSVEKFPEKAVPAFLRGTVAEQVVKDQISGSHPYAALAVPRLAQATGVYHANPKLVYLPAGPELGIYQEDFGDALYLLEERPDGNWEHADHFANAPNIISTQKLLTRLQKDNDNLVDQQQLLKSRIFDLWLGDWDRHDDQWRWAQMPETSKGITYYKPIPRDRDQVFFNAQGFLMTVGTRKWGMRKFQGFKDEIRDPEGLAFNARYFDRSFLTAPDLKQWLETVQAMKDAITPALIREAMGDMPKEIYPYHGPEIERKLQNRLAQLPRSATSLYLSLAKEVDVVGSDKKEYFLVERLNNEQTRVRVWKLKAKSDERDHKLYDRTFERSETKEIRLYGLGGNDRFELKGKVTQGIKVRVIGGDGHDTFTDSSLVTRRKFQTIVYDTPDNTFFFNPHTKNKVSTNPEVNHYDRKAFHYDIVSPVLALNFNPDDGIFLGGGGQSVKHGFRKSPYKSKQVFKGNYAFLTNSFNFLYFGEFNDVFGDWDLLGHIDLRRPSFTSFFYGVGNETNNNIRDFGRPYYRVRYNLITVSPSVRKRSENLRHDLRFGPIFQHIKLEEEDEAVQLERFIFQEYAPTLSAGAATDLFETNRYFAGAQASYAFDLRNARHATSRGLFFQTHLTQLFEASDPLNTKVNFLQAVGNLAWYFSFGTRFRTTFALRSGGIANFGNYEPVYQSAFLGGHENLRGYRIMRFAGQKAFYQNHEVRIKLFQVKTLLMPLEIGMNGFYDLGRVWVSQDPSVPSGNSQRWHRGHGGGLWIAPAHFPVISFELGRSEEEKILPFLRFGFLF